MEMTDFNITMVWNAISILFSLITFGFCVYYVVRKQSADSILLTVGSFIHLLVTIFYSFFTVQLISKFELSAVNMASIYAVVNGISILGGILFTIGLIILIFNYLALISKKEEQKLF